jgi:hypothetical protein
MTIRYTHIAGAFALAAAAFLVAPGAGPDAVPGIAQASAQQMGNQPWKARPRNAANALLIIEQYGRGNRNSSSAQGIAVGGGGSNSSTVMVCGGGMDANAAAAANVSCIFIGDDTIANINTDQSSIGDQTATSESNTTIADEVETILNGGNHP